MRNAEHGLNMLEGLESILIDDADPRLALPKLSERVERFPFAVMGG
jgi:hypothetical protein